jgi:hypothetical protein
MHFALFSRMLIRRKVSSRQRVVDTAQHESKTAPFTPPLSVSVTTILARQFCISFYSVNIEETTGNPHLHTTWSIKVAVYTLSGKLF